MCVKLDSRFFELAHGNLIDMAAQKIKDLEVTEEDALEIKNEGFSDFWDWNDYLAKKKQIQAMRELKINLNMEN